MAWEEDRWDSSSDQVEDCSCGLPAPTSVPPCPHLCAQATPSSPQGSLLRKAHPRLLVAASSSPSRGPGALLGPAGGWSPPAAGLYLAQEGLSVPHVTWNGPRLEGEGPE